MEIFRAIVAVGASLVFWAGASSARGATNFDYGAFLKSVRVPPGFTVELAAGEPAIRFPMFACFDDDGRLYVVESSGKDLYAGLQKLTRDCQVSRLEDADGDGHFEKATIFQEGVTFPMGLAWRDGRLYLADPPDLVALTDTNGDGRADKREVILTGFGHTDNGSLHGLTFGPDGLLYFTMGEPDGWKLPRGDGTFLQGKAGALFRSRPDGSRPEVISRGFENLVEIEFMPGGEFVGTDNWYQVPAAGYRDALIDCAPGGLYPYAPDRGTPLPRTGITLPPLVLLPAVAHSGLTRLRTMGFPAEWRQSLFVAEHNTRKVVRHELRRAGSTFASTNFDFAASDHPDFHPSDVLEDADGSLLIVDTGGWYVEHCPTGRIRDSRAPGGIYRVRWKQAPKISDARGRSLRWVNSSVTELVQRLDDARPVVAERAANELVRRREVMALLSVLGPRETIEVRVRALWALGRLSDSDSLAGVRAQLTASDPIILCAVARVLALREDKTAGKALAALLDSTNAPVRRAAAEALAVCGSRAQAPKLIAALASAGDDFEQHACIAAVLALADEPFVRGLLKHEASRVRRAALHLLDQPPFGTLRFTDLVAPLGEENASMSEAARHLLGGHRNWAGEALPWLRSQMAAEVAVPGRTSVLANLFIAFQSETGVRKLISELLEPTASTSEWARAFLLDLLPSLTTRRPEAAWLNAIPPALTNATFRVAALRAAMAYPKPDFQSLLATLAEDSAIPASQRLLAARISARQPALSESVFALALNSLEPKAAPTDRLVAVDLLARARLSPTQLRRLLERLPGGGPVAPDPLLPAFTRAADEETRPVLAKFFAARLQDGWSPARATIDQVLSIFSDGASIRASLLTAWEQNNGARLRRLNGFKPLLAGGNAERGREWFTTATCAGCHRVGERGVVGGPDLTRIGAIRSGSDLLESILYPSSSFAQGYEPYLLTRRDGEELFGSLLTQGPEGVSLRDATGGIYRVRSDDIAALERQSLSAMPEGLEQSLTREQFCDLLAYLQSLK